jgi:hypothetical protein
MNAALLVRWSARLLSLAFAALFAVFAIGEGLPPIFRQPMLLLPFGLLMICLVGLLLAWRIEVVGAALGLVGSVGFYLNDFYLNDFRSFPRGWAFPMLIVTPLLYFAATVLERRYGKRRPDAR